MLIGLQIEHFALMIWTLLIVSIKSDELNRNHTDARIITNVLEKIIKSKAESNHLIDIKRRMVTNEYNESEIENELKLKLKELKPMLQDNDYSIKDRKSNSTIEESEETVIIEHVPEKTRRANINSAYTPIKQSTNISQKNIKYYKQLRHNITKMLDKVNTGDSTKKLITRTFDGMLALLIEQKCKRKSRNSTALLNHLIKDTRKSMPELTKIIEMMLRPKSVLSAIEIHDKTGNITEIIPQLLLPMTKLLKDKKIKCYLDRKENPSAKTEGPASARRQFRRLGASSPINKGPCDSFIVCTNELTDFLKITYNSLKNTAIDSYSNYKDLQQSAVTETNKVTKETVTAQLKVLKNLLEQECKQIFIKQLGLFKLDKNKRKITNILRIRRFLKILSDKLKNRKFGFMVDGKNFRLDVKDDFTKTLRWNKELCKFFVLCNGQNQKKSNLYKNVYVEVENSLNDELENSLTHYGEKNLYSVEGGNMISLVDKSILDVMDQKKYSHVNVTRTTLRSTATTEGPESGSIEYFFK